MQRARVLIADDHPEVAKQLRTLLETEFEVLAIAKDGNAMVMLAEKLKPDVIVSDIAMPNLDGIEAAKIILKKNPDARVVFVTIHNDPALLQKSIEAGGMAFVLKVAAGDELIPAVHAALKRKHYAYPANGKNKQANR
jgi:DNA-binding NarL/FixJ family response regulator